MLFTITSYAKNYYISANGSNTNNGLTPTTAWQSIAKLNANFFFIAGGDSILFKRGEIFYGSIVVNKSGTSLAPIVISAYGTGAKPIITGLTTLASWTPIGSGIYQADAASVKSTVNLVTLNNIPQAVGRYPNADATGGGYLTYESYSYSGGATITDNQLTGSPNWTGAEVVIRKDHWLTERCKVSKHSGSTLTYTATDSFFSNNTPSPAFGTNGFGYFIQRDPRTLDQSGEWYFDTVNKKMLMYFGSNNPSLYNIKVSTLDTLINIGDHTYISINNLSFEGAKMAAIYASHSGNLTIQYCDIKLMGLKGIFIFNSPNVLIENVRTNNVLSTAIDITNGQTVNATVRNCVVKNTGTLAGMGSYWDNDYVAISVTVASGGLIEYNTVDTTGYIGIRFKGSNFIVQKNVVNYYDFVMDDGGGIYNDERDVYHTNRKINNNIIMNGIGAPMGAGGEIDVDGIFLDGQPMNVDIFNNTVFNIGVNGIYCNNPVNVNIRGNTSFNNGSSIGITRYANYTISNLSIKQNIFYPKYNTQFNFEYLNTGVNVPVVTTIQAAMQGLGDIDNNYYATPNATGFYYYYRLTENSELISAKPLSFEGWKSFTNHDLASTLPPIKIASYTLERLITSNLVTNGQFTINISGIYIWSPDGNVTSVWDNSRKITGTGSLKITPAISSNDYTLLYGAIGEIFSSKKYILRFSTLGTAANGALKAYLRKTGSPYTALIPAQVANFGTSKITHKFLFTAPTTEAEASFIIEIDQSSGITYIDDIELYEADATLLNFEDQLRFEYNPTNEAKTITLDAKYITPDSYVYEGSITLQPYTSPVLIKSDIIATGIKKLNTNSYSKNMNNFSVYPNPAHEILNIDCKEEKEGVVLISILDINGRKYLDAKLIGLHKSLNISSLPKGIYFIEINYNGRKEVLRFIKV